MLLAGANSLARLGAPIPRRVDCKAFRDAVTGCLDDRARNMIFAVLLGCALLAMAIGVETGPAWGAANEDSAPGAVKVDPDPLRRFLPRSDIYTPVPGGIYAVRDDSTPEDSVEERAQNLHGGLVVGYCLRASCSRVTHLAVVQICNNRIGGTDGSQQLILGVVKLPVGDVPGWLMSLQGRRYAENFARFGPFTQDLLDDTASDNSALQNILADGMGPVAPLHYVDLAPTPQQSGDTLALQSTIVGHPQLELRFPYLEVRHYCELPTS